MSNYVYIAMSLDGYIADKNNNLDWLTEFPNEDKIDFGYIAFKQKIDALVMGRNTLDFVLQFEDWPYEEHVYVLSNTLKSAPEGLEEKITILSGEFNAIIKTIEEKGHSSLYIDGGKVIQGMLQANLIDEMIITIVPILVGGGYSLFGELDDKIQLKLLSSSTFNNGFIQNHYRIE